MKNKPLMIGLLIVVVVIWGNVIFKFVNNMGAKDESWDAFMTEQSIQLPTPEDLDFDLMIDYPDPFLIARKKTTQSTNKEDLAFERAFEEEISNASSIVRAQTKRENNQVNNKQEQLPPSHRLRPFKWPNISYHGVVKRQGNPTSGLLMVKINNELINVRQGDYFLGDFKITRSWRDSVEIINESMETKMFYR